MEKDIKKFYITRIVWISLMVILMIITFIKLDRIVLFSKLFSTSNNFFNFIIILLYFVSIVLILFSNIYTLYSYYREKDFDKTKKILNILDLPLFICKCFSIILLLLIFIVTPCTIDGASMENTFHTGDKVICYNFFYEPKRDDVIVFDSKNYTNNNMFYIKRVIAIENDHILYNKDTNQFYVNDMLKDSSITLYQYENIKNSIGIEDGIYEFDVPKNKVLVFGDNRGNSDDSRHFGFINEEDIYGEIVFQVYPFKKIGRIKKDVNYSS